MDLLRELWLTRCGFINAGRILTEREMLRHRTLQMHRDNIHRRDMLPVLDRNLLQHEESYFLSSSKETLELWESRLKKVFKQLKTPDPSQPLISSVHATPPSCTQHPSEPTISQRLESLDNYITRMRLLKKKRQMTNQDPTWNKRLKLTAKGIIMKKRKLKRKTEVVKKVGYCHVRAPIPVCLWLIVCLIYTTLLILL